MRFWSALSAELRALDITTLYTMELPELIGADLRLPITGISPLAETLVLLRYVELRLRLYRLVSVFKVRDGAFDPTLSLCAHSRGVLSSAYFRQCSK